MILASAWLTLALLLCAFAWMASKRLAVVTLPVAVTLAAFCIYLPLGKPIPFKPGAGDYKVLGAKIEVNVAIWVLLDDGKSEPRYFRLPYSNSQADALQSAMAGEGGARAKVGEDGGVAYDGPPPVSGEPPKQAETPAVTLP